MRKPIGKVKQVRQTKEGLKVEIALEPEDNPRKAWEPQIATGLSTEHAFRKIKAGSPEAQAANLMASVLSLLGFSTGDASTRDTPERWVRFITEFTKGTGPTEEILGDLFDIQRSDSTQGMIVQTGIPFRMICEHHLLPAIGFAHIGYLPRKAVVGLSKLSRLVDAVGTEKPSLQEAITARIASILYDKADAMGTAVVIEAEHTCMACRGVSRAGVKTLTSSVLGVFRDVPQARSEFLTLINKKGTV